MICIVCIECIVLLSMHNGIVLWMSTDKPWCPCLSQQTSSAPADPGILLDLSPIKLIFLTNIVKFLETIAIHNSWASFQNLLTTPSTNFIWYNIGPGNDKCKWMGIEKWDISDILSSVRLLLYRQEAASLRAWHGLCFLTQYLPGRRIFDLSSVIAGYHQLRASVFDGHDMSHWICLFDVKFDHIFYAILV